jgi:hypothetical protein
LVVVQMAADRARRQRSHPTAKPVPDTMRSWTATVAASSSRMRGKGKGKGKGKGGGGSGGGKSRSLLKMSGFNPHSSF